MKQETKPRLVAIDSGTTEILAVEEEGHLLLLDGTRPSMPSDIVFDEDGQPVWGQSARNMAMLYPERHCADYKRYIGKSEPVIAAPGVEYTAQQLAEKLFEYLYEKLRRMLATPDLLLVLTCPAYFDSYQRKCLWQAAEKAGFRVIGLADEPLAAGLFASTAHRPGQKTVVADDGGGTVDVTLLEWQDETTVRVLSKVGDRDGAGNDIDRLLVHAAIERAGKASSKKLDFDDPDSRRQIAELCSKVRDAKHDLSERLKTTLVYSLCGQQYVWEITRAEFDSLIAPVLDIHEKLLKQLLEAASLTPAEVDELVLVGGTSNIPAVRQRAEQVIGKASTAKGNPQEAVVRGALALAPQFAAKVDRELTQDLRLLPGVSTQNITVKPLSVAVIRNRHDHTLVASEMIPKGTKLPAEFEDRFSPARDGQTAIEALVVEAPNKTEITDSMTLGRIPMEIPERYGKENLERISIRFVFDESSILHVFVRDRESGTEKELTIEYKGE